LKTLVAIVSSLYVQAAAGLAIFAGVYKFFKTIDENLNKETASAIADWLLGSPTEQPRHWPDAFANVFNKLFGEKQLSWKCVGVSALTTVVSLFGIAPFIVLSRGTPVNWRYILTVIPIQVLGGLVPGYLCILLTRRCIWLLQRTRPVFLALIVVVIASYGGYLLSVTGPFISDFLDAHLVHRYYGPEPFAGLKEGIDTMLGAVYAAILASLASTIWLWLYLFSSLILKALVKVKKGFRGFSRTLNIKEKPVACLGLVAGATCAVSWWSFLLVRFAIGGWPSQ
jgi:hypothetical protein